MSSITFEGEAHEVLVAVASTIPQGYTVSLLDVGEEPDPSSTYTPGVDVSIVAINDLGVHYVDVDRESGEPTTGPRKLRSWDTIDRIHVY